MSEGGRNSRFAWFLKIKTGPEPDSYDHCGGCLLRITPSELSSVRTQSIKPINARAELVSFQPINILVEKDTRARKNNTTEKPKHR